MAKNLTAPTPERLIDFISSMNDLLFILRRPLRKLLRRYQRGPQRSLQP